MELAAASEMSLGYRVDKQPTWHPIWRARYRVAVDCRPEFRSRGLRREAVGAASRDGGLVGRACLETPDPRVEIGIDGAISPESRQFSHEAELTASMASIQ